MFSNKKILDSVSMNDILDQLGLMKDSRAYYTMYGTPFRPSHKLSLLVKQDGFSWIERGMKDAAGNSIEVRGDIIEFLNSIGAVRTRDEAYEWLDRFPNEHDMRILKTLVDFPCPKFDLTAKDSISAPRIRIVDESCLADPMFLQKVLGESVNFNIARAYLSEGIIEHGGIINTTNRVLLFHNSFGGAVSFSRFEIRAVGNQGYSILNNGNCNQLVVFQSVELFLESMSDGSYVPRGETELVINHYKIFPSAIPITEQYSEVRFYLTNCTVTKEMVCIINNSKIKHKSIIIK